MKLSSDSFVKRNRFTVSKWSLYSFLRCENGTYFIYLAQSSIFLRQHKFVFGRRRRVKSRILNLFTHDPLQPALTNWRKAHATVAYKINVICFQTPPREAMRGEGRVLLNVAGSVSQDAARRFFLDETAILDISLREVVLSLLKFRNATKSVKIDVFLVMLEPIKISVSILLGPEIKLQLRHNPSELRLLALLSKIWINENDESSKQQSPSAFNQPAASYHSVNIMLEIPSRAREQFARTYDRHARIFFAHWHPGKMRKMCWPQPNGATCVWAWREDIINADGPITIPCSCALR